MNEQLDQYAFIETDFMDEHVNKFSHPVCNFLIIFSYLEYALDKLISEIINSRSDLIGYIVTSEMSMANKIDLLERFVNLGKHHGLKWPHDINVIIKKLKSINKFRNRIAHANWSSMRHNGITRVKTKVDQDNGVYFENFNLSLKAIHSAQLELDSTIKLINSIELET